MLLQCHDFALNKTLVAQVLPSFEDNMFVIQLMETLHGGFFVRTEHTDIGCSHKTAVCKQNNFLVCLFFAFSYRWQIRPIINQGQNIPKIWYM